LVIGTPWPELKLARAAAIRGIAGDIQKLASLVTTWALIWGPDRADRIVALATSPISQVALRTDIPGEFAGSGKAAQGTFHFPFLGRHLSHLLFSLSWIVISSQQFALSLICKNKMAIPGSQGCLRFRLQVANQGQLWG
jgi:hypothetical protein